MQTLLEAFAVVLIIEGILPLIAPSKWISMMQSFSLLSINKIRIFGMVAVLLGVLTLLLL